MEISFDLINTRFTSHVYVNVIKDLRQQINQRVQTTRKNLEMLEWIKFRMNPKKTNQKLCNNTVLVNYHINTEY